MSRKSKRTKGIEEARPFAGTPALHASRQRGASEKSAEEIGQALTGTWRAEHLFVLKHTCPDALSGISGDV